MSIFITADTHFNHKNIITYENRPFKDVHEMNETIISNWNSVVSKFDTVYHLGDVGWGSKEEITNLIGRLNGYKILIKGNHDKKSKSWYHDVGFDSVIDGGVILEEFYLLSHKPMYVNKNMSPYINVHGHIHGNQMDGDAYYNACVEHHNYTPVNFDKIKREDT